MRTASRRFAVGLGVALAAAALLNVLSFVWSFVDPAPAKDGYQTLGFPFAFLREGGKDSIYEFHYWAALFDAGLALIVALQVGHACKRVRRDA
jgi:hypothetical protein